MTDGKESVYPQLCAATDWEGTPNGASESEGGITKREYFAAMAMQGFLASMPPELYLQVRDALGFRILAESAVVQANALITALNKEVQR